MILAQASPRPLDIVEDKQKEGNRSLSIRISCEKFISLIKSMFRMKFTFVRHKFIRTKIKDIYRCWLLRETFSPFAR